MEIIVMGCGTSQGVPLPAHDNPGLDLKEPRNWRTRASVHVVIEGHHVQIDAAPEFRLQCIHNGIRQVDTFILTHGHADHVLGMDDLRQFCSNREGWAIPVHSTPVGLERVRAVFPYALTERTMSGYVALTLHEMGGELLLPGGGVVRSTPLPHGREEVLGLVFEEPSTGARFAYFTDCKALTPKARALAAGADLMIIDALRPNAHPTHLTVDEALAEIDTVRPQRALLTHMTYQVGWAEYSAKLAGRSPETGLCHDGMRISLG
jgi:phosphoribosyl 1,2-cyclic phosphate phosphodiesterase